MRLVDADALQEEYVRLSGRELSLINDALTIDAEPVKYGHWIKTLNYYENGHFYYQCSQCGYHQVAHHFADEYKYCTNCGAKMDEVEK